MSAHPDKHPLDLAILRAASARTYRGAVTIAPFTTDAAEAALPGVPPMVVFRRIEALERKGPIDCGVSLRSGWATAAGDARLVELEAEEARRKASDGGTGP